VFGFTSSTHLNPIAFDGTQVGDLFDLKLRQPNGTCYWTTGKVTEKLSNPLGLKMRLLVVQDTADYAYVPKRLPYLLTRCRYKHAKVNRLDGISATRRQSESSITDLTHVMLIPDIEVFSEVSSDSDS